MYPSAALCRTQEALQRSRAANATLANVRSVAEKAAAAWGTEALYADKRERRDEHARSVRAGMSDAQLQERDDRAFSEHPDRGFVS